jgi:hypothetical protein
MKKKILVLLGNSYNEKTALQKPFALLANNFSGFYDVVFINLVQYNNFPLHITMEEYVKTFDYIIFRRCFGGNYDQTIEILKNLKGTSVKTIIYVDEFWQIPSTHPLYRRYIKYKIHDKMNQIIGLSDKVFTYGNDKLVKEIHKIHPFEVYKISTFSIGQMEDEVYVDELKFDYKRKSLNNKPVIGIVPNDIYDLDNIRKLEGMHKYVIPSFFNTIQLVLVGFNSFEMEIDKDNNEVAKKVNETTWAEYERIITNDYKICSPEYKSFLLKFLPNKNYEGNIDEEPYKRIWADEVKLNADTCFYNILLRPLAKNKYNELFYDYEAAKAIHTENGKGEYIKIINTMSLPKQKYAKCVMNSIIDAVLEYRQTEIFKDTSLHLNNLYVKLDRILNN